MVLSTFLIWGGAQVLTINSACQEGRNTPRKARGIDIYSYVPPDWIWQLVFFKVEIRGGGSQTQTEIHSLLVIDSLGSKAKCKWVVTFIDSLSAMWIYACHWFHQPGTNARRSPGNLVTREAHGILYLSEPPTQSLFYSVDLGGESLHTNRDSCTAGLCWSSDPLVKY